MNKRVLKISIWSAVGVMLLAIVAFACYHYYRLMKFNLQSKDNETHELYIYPNTTVAELPALIGQFAGFQSEKAFMQHCKWLDFNYPEPGHYTIPARCGDYELVQMLKFGRQTAVKITFNNIRTRQQLAARLGAQLLTDSTSIDDLLCDTAFLNQHNLNTATALLYFLPDSYEVYWTITPVRLFERMETEFKHFWNIGHRREKADKIGLTQSEISTLASIVEEENSAHPDEWARIAGLYLNRLRLNMPLQADPTVKFANADFGISRVLNRHLDIESPYNTYKIIGLPPGPIRVPSIAAIDAVLNAEKHDYLFMCADFKMNGYHRFARTSAEHANNARMYQNELNKRKIFK